MTTTSEVWFAAAAQDAGTTRDETAALTKLLDQVQGLAYAHRWDTTGGAHVLAAHILNVIEGAR